MAVGSGTQGSQSKRRTTRPNSTRPSTTKGSHTVASPPRATSNPSKPSNMAEDGRAKSPLRSTGVTVTMARSQPGSPRPRLSIPESIDENCASPTPSRAYKRSHSSAEVELRGSRLARASSGRTRKPRERSQSAINPRDVKEMHEQRQREKQKKMTPAEKRARNRTTALTQSSVPSRDGDDEGDEPPPAWQREANMRKEIMTLQKQHIIELQRERDSLKQDLTTVTRQLHTLTTASDTDLDSVQERCRQLEEERDAEAAKLKRMMQIVKELVEEPPRVELRAAVRDAFEMSPGFREAEFSRIATTLRWEDMDDEVERQNQELDRSLSQSPRRVDRPTPNDPAIAIASLRARLQPQLRNILYASNDIRIRAAALAPDGGSVPSSPSTASQHSC
eukprot:m.7787 g.7787  ORF g.7787 m.7787 type:complete len:392 (-) comp3045_c0_seq2:273-1448(-)